MVSFCQTRRVKAAVKNLMLVVGNFFCGTKSYYSGSLTTLLKRWWHHSNQGGFSREDEHLHPSSCPYIPSSMTSLFPTRVPLPAWQLWCNQDEVGCSRRSEMLLVWFLDKNEGSGNGSMSSCTTPLFLSFRSSLLGVGTCEMSVLSVLFLSSCVLIDCWMLFTHDARSLPLLSPQRGLNFSCPSNNTSLTTMNLWYRTNFHSEERSAKNLSLVRIILLPWSSILRFLYGVRHFQSSQNKLINCIFSYWTLENTDIKI